MRLMQRSTVLLPHPDGPMSAVIWCFGTSKVTPVTARKLPYKTLSSRSDRIAPVSPTWLLIADSSNITLIGFLYFLYRERSCTGRAAIIPSVVYHFTFLA